MRVAQGLSITAGPAEAKSNVGLDRMESGQMDDGFYASWYSGLNTHTISKSGNGMCMRSVTSL